MTTLQPDQRLALVNLLTSLAGNDPALIQQLTQQPVGSLAPVAPLGTDMVRNALFSSFIPPPQATPPAQPAAVEPPKSLVDEEIRKRLDFMNAHLDPNLSKHVSAETRESIAKAQFKKHFPDDDHSLYFPSKKTIVKKPIRVPVDPPASERKRQSPEKKSEEKEVPVKRSRTSPPPPSAALDEKGLQQDLGLTSESEDDE
jgi:hypothetical protein